MTDEQINQRIAEACGWKIFSKPLTGCGFAAYAKSPNGDPSPGVPDYCNDLNSVAEACESVFSESNAWSTFVYKLSKIICAGHYTDHDTLIMTNRATARQRAEAFLRTLGKWEEVQG